MDVVGADLGRHLGFDAVRLRDLLGGEALALQHIEEVGVAAEVELIGPLQLDAAVLEEPGENPVHDRGAHLGLDVIADDRHAALLEAAAPVGFAGEEHRHAVDEGTAGLEHLLRVPLDGFLAADRQVIHHHISLGRFQDADDVGGRAGGFGDDLREVLAQPVVRHPALDPDARMGDVREFDRVVVPGEDRIR